MEKAKTKQHLVEFLRLKRENFQIRQSYRDTLISKDKNYANNDVITNLMHTLLHPPKKVGSEIGSLR
jgi:hypothetical protein